MKCFECKHKTDLYLSKEGVLIIKGDKGARLNYEDIAMVYIPRRKKMTIITVDHRMYTLKFYDIIQLDVALKMFQEAGIEIKIYIGRIK